VDLRLFAGVLWRFKFLVLVGLMLAVVLAVLSVASVSTSGIAYRQAVLWSSTTRIGITQEGFPWGRLLVPDEFGNPTQEGGVPQADPNRLNTLAVLYAELATSDPVRRLLAESGTIPLCEQENSGSGTTDTSSKKCGKLIATPVVVGDNRVMLPFIDLTAIAASPRAAMNLAQDSADAFATYIRTRQVANNVPADDRVIVEQLVRPKPAEVARPRSKTMPIVVFLAVMLATIGLAFLLENLRPPKPKPTVVQTVRHWEPDAGEPETTRTRSRGV
jgi:hypothetical protein